MGRGQKCNCHCPKPPCCPDDVLPNTLTVTFASSGYCTILDGNSFTLTRGATSCCITGISGPNIWLVDLGDCNTPNPNYPIGPLIVPAAGALTFTCLQNAAGCTDYHLFAYLCGSNQGWGTAQPGCTCSPPYWEFKNSQINLGQVQQRAPCCLCCEALAGVGTQCNEDNPIFTGATNYLPDATVTA